MDVNLNTDLVRGVMDGWANSWRKLTGPATTRKPTPRGKYCLRLWKENMQILVVPREKGTLVALILDGKQVDKYVVYNVAPKTMSAENAVLYVLEKINNQVHTYFAKAQETWKEAQNGNVSELREGAPSPA